MSRFAAILLLQLPLQAALRLRPEAVREPIAIVEGGVEKGRVLEMTDAAAASGVRRGMVSTQAMARCPALRLWPRSREQEQTLTALLVEMGFAFSAFVEATSEALCLLDLRQVKAGDWEQWARVVVERCAGVKLRVQVGLASNPDLAALAAQRAEPVLVVQHPGTFLADLAITEMDAPPELVAILRDWGIGDLGALARLPRNELVERLGPSAGGLWERAIGRAWRELRFAHPPETFAEAFDFEAPIETTEPLLFILRRQLDQLSFRLCEAYRVAVQMTLTILLDNHSEVYERVFTIPSPTADTGVLYRILHTHLETLRLEQQPIGVRLRIKPVIGQASQRPLFGVALRDPNRFAETLGRLAALVGTEHVGVVELQDTHRPDSFRLVTPDFEKTGGREENWPAENRALGLPLKRFRPPQPAQVRCTSGVPTWLSSRMGEGQILDAAGPYRGSGQWWDRHAWSTEEWDVELGNGAIYRISKQDSAWFVEGCCQAAVSPA